ncbi:hypothetical protein, partial [Nocardia abscessus]|uniref:hypothetical protein n=1 Tax=Nocardia abscessus TaxID=120957 RepID=UPI0024579006
AQKYGRRVCFVGRSMVRNMQIAQDLGYLTVPEGVVVDLDVAATLPGPARGGGGGGAGPPPPRSFVSFVMSHLGLLDRRRDVAALVDRARRNDGRRNQQSR